MHERIFVILELLVQVLRQYLLAAELSQLSIELLLHPELEVVWEELILFLEAHVVAHAALYLFDFVGFFDVDGLRQVVDAEDAGPGRDVFLVGEHLGEVLHQGSIAAEAVALLVNDDAARIAYVAHLAECVVASVNRFVAIDPGISHNVAHPWSYEVYLESAVSICGCLGHRIGLLHDLFVTSHLRC